MKYLKKSLGAIGLSLLVVLIAVLTILVAPALLLYIGFEYLYDKLWRTLRRDPNIDMTIKELHNDKWLDNTTLDAYIQAFQNLSDYIVAQTDANATTLEVAGFDRKEDDINSLESGSTMQLKQALSTKHSTIDLSLDLQVFHDENGNSIITLLDDDAACGNNSPPLDVRVRKPDLRTERHFTLGNIYSIWTVISLLRGDVRFTLREGQLWANIPERNVWIVQYKPSQPAFGLRSQFTGAIAREHGRDVLYPDYANTQKLPE